jgi:2-keto-4-pentenoate hydratase/2-oxohepta-3-ene-1,7-dioic acid hydratase in catechol pathway
MKLLRFELRSEPGRARSGIVQGGRIYETENGEGVAIHEAIDVKPLIPLAHVPSVRFFHRDYQPENLSAFEAEDPVFFYGNPNALIGPSQMVFLPPFAAHLTVRGFVAAITVSDGHALTVPLAEETILGFTLMLALVGPSEEAQDRQTGRGFGRSYDIATALGPVLTTPEELEDFTLTEEFGRHFGLEAVLRVNGVERARGNTGDIPLTFAQAVSSASQSCPIRETDLFAIGPVTQSTDPIFVAEGDEIQLSVEALGTLSIKISH